MQTKIFFLILVCGFLLTSCVDDPDGPELDFEVKFDVEFRGPNNPESASSDNPIEIFESESVTFTNSSIDTTGGISKPIEISSVLWSFEGGDPESTTNHHPTVVYPNEGKYNVSLEIRDIAGNGAYEEWNDYVTVSLLEPKPEEEELEPEEICLIINEEVDDGRIANFFV